MSCLFFLSNKAGPDCNRLYDQGYDFVNKYPSKKQVYQTALDCPGLSFGLGQQAGDINFDSFLRLNKDWQRDKGKNNISAKQYTDLVFERNQIYDSKFKLTERDIFHDHLEKSRNKLNIYEKKEKSKSESNSKIPYNFYYHFENPQKNSPFLSGFNIQQDTRMDLRRQNGQY